MTYAAHLIKDVVTQVIIGEVEWATENLGGVWVACPSQVSANWLYVDGEFRPEPPFPSWSWDGSEYQPPTPEPDPVAGFGWTWDEDAQAWQQVAIPDEPPAA